MRAPTQDEIRQFRQWVEIVAPSWSGVVEGLVEEVYRQRAERAVHQPPATAEDYKDHLGSPPIVNISDSFQEALEQQLLRLSSAWGGHCASVNNNLHHAAWWVHPDRSEKDPAYLVEQARSAHVMADMAALKLLKIRWLVQHCLEQVEAL